MILKLCQIVLRLEQLIYNHIEQQDMDQYKMNYNYHKIVVKIINVYM